MSQIIIKSPPNTIFEKKIEDHLLGEFVGFGEQAKDEFSIHFVFSPDSTKNKYFNEKLQESAAKGLEAIGPLEDGADVHMVFQVVADDRWYLTSMKNKEEAYSFCTMNMHLGPIRYIRIRNPNKGVRYKWFNPSRLIF